MSVRVMSWVWDKSHARGNDRLVLLAIADIANDQGEASAYARSVGHIATKTKLAPSTVRERVRALIKLGELEITAEGGGRASNSYRVLMGSVENPADVHTPPESGAPKPGGQHAGKPVGTPPDPGGHPTGGPVTHHPVLNPSQPSLSLQHPPTGPTLSDRARLIAQRVWEEKKPRPATKFIAMSKVLEQLLEAGHDDEAVRRAAMTAPTITVRAVEFTLNSSPGAGRAARVAQPMDSDRGGQEGRIEL